MNFLPQILKELQRAGGMVSLLWVYWVNGNFLHIRTRCFIQKLSFDERHHEVLM